MRAEIGCPKRAAKMERKERRREKKAMKREMKDVRDEKYRLVVSYRPLGTAY